jgi:hypothetical protein
VQNIKQTSAATVSATVAYMLYGAKLAAGTSATITDGASRVVMFIPAAGDFMLPAPLMMTGLITTGTFTDLQIYVE